MGFIIKNQPAQLARPPKGSFFMATSTYPRVTWYKNARLRRLYFYCVILILTNVANGFDGSMMNGLQSLPFWQNFFHHPHSSILGFFNSAMSLGSLVGLPLIPPMIDRLGRKFGVIFGSVIVIIGGALQAASINFGMFVGARMMLGFGMVIATAAAPLLVAEIAHPQDRALLCTFMGVSYGIGSFIASWVTFGTLKLQSNWAWRLPSLLQVMCSILVLCLIWFIPESPRWYISKDKPEKALEILAYYHADGDEKDEVVQLEFTEICTSFALDKEAHTSSRYVDFLKTEGNRRRIGIITALALFSQWSGNGLVSYYLSIIMRSVGITNPTDQLGINAGLQTFGLVVAFAFSFLIDSLGRRKLYIWGTIGTLLTFVVWTIFSARYTIQGDDPGLGKGVVVMIFFYNFFYNLKSGVFQAYVIEIMPYGLRAKASIWASFTILAAVFFNQYINAIALDAIHWKYYLVYCCFLVVEVFVVYRYVIETRYTPMEEIARYFDGESADVVELTIAQKRKGDMEEGVVTEVVHEESVKVD